MSQARRDRLARNESWFRSINEDLERGLQTLTFDENELAGFVCECSNRECSELVHVALERYQEVRGRSDRFFVTPGHEALEVEDVVESTSAYNVVQKHDDVSEIVERGDRRRA